MNKRKSSKLLIVAVKKQNKKVSFSGFEQMWRFEYVAALNSIIFLRACHIPLFLSRFSFPTSQNRLQARVRSLRIRVRVAVL
jgi:hypothetical protein